LILRIATLWGWLEEKRLLETTGPQCRILNAGLRERAFRIPVKILKKSFMAGLFE
jgi:hypothetical protein